MPVELAGELCCIPLPQANKKGTASMAVPFFRWLRGTAHCYAEWISQVCFERWLSKEMGRRRDSIVMNN